MCWLLRKLLYNNTCKDVFYSPCFAHNNNKLTRYVKQAHHILWALGVRLMTCHCCLCCSSDTSATQTNSLFGKECRWQNTKRCKTTML